MNTREGHKPIARSPETLAGEKRVLLERVPTVQRGGFTTAFLAMRQGAALLDGRMVSHCWRSAGLKAIQQPFAGGGYL